MALNLNLPGYYKSPWYEKTQQDLYGFGSGLLKGDVPDYYKSMGEYGGSEFESLLGLTKRDIGQSVSEDMARRRVGSGGAGASAVAKATADASTQMRWADYMRAMQGKQYLMGAGLETVGGVRSAGLTEQGQQNQFNLSKAGMEFDINRYNEQTDLAKKQRKAGLWSQILSSGIGAAGTIAGMYFGGPGGAAAGGKIGSALGGKKDYLYV